MDSLSKTNFPTFMEKHSGLVRKMILEIAPDIDFQYIDDVEQEVWAKVWEVRDKYSGDAKLTTWVAAIARNVTSDWVRANVVRWPPVDLETEVAEGGDAVDGSWLECHAIEATNPEELLIAAETEDALSRVISERLTEREQEIYQLSWVEGLSDLEVAKALGYVAGGNLRVAKTRIRNKLRQVM